MSKTETKTTQTTPTVEQQSSDATRPDVETVRSETTFGTASEWHKTVVLARIKGHRGIVQHRRTVRITSGAAPAKTSLDPDATFDDLNEFSQEILQGKAPEVDEWY